MFPKYLNGRLISAVVAVALSASFYYEPSFPRRIKESGHEIQKFEKIMKGEDDLNDKKMMELYSNILERNKNHDTTYWASQSIGAILGWRAAEIYGGRSVLIQGNIVRLFGAILHLGEFAYRTYHPLSISSQRDPLSAEEEPIKCTCVHFTLHFEKVEITKEVENATKTTTNTPTTATETPSPSSSESAPIHVNEKLSQIPQLDISLWSKCVNGIHSGMSTFVGIMYLYDIAPKKILKIHSISLLALYFFLTTAIKYAVEIGLSPQVIYASPANASSWLTSGTLTCAAIVIQVVLLLRFCPDSPSFLLHKKNKENAKKALIQLRKTDQVDKELEILEKKTGQRDPLFRSTLIISIYIIYMIYNYTYLFHGILSAVSLGIPLEICVNIYYVVNIFSLLLPLIFYNNLYLVTIRNVLFYYYLILGCMYLIINSMVASVVHFKTDDLNNRQTTSGVAVAMTLLMHVFYTSGTALFTIVLISEYSSQAARGWNIVLAAAAGATFASGGIYIFLKSILIFYNFQPIPWLFLSTLLMIVAIFEMTQFGLKPDRFDPFSGFDVCFKLGAPIKKVTKPEIKA